MGWKEKVKEFLSLPAEAQVISIYRYQVPRGEKIHEYLRCEYLLNGKRKTKHIPRNLERTFEKLMEFKEREEALKLLDELYAKLQELRRYRLDAELLSQYREVVEEAQKILKEKEETNEV